ncbi:MAG: 30S ribosomal protein S2 [Candidatus Heimdallarchaeota archaeon LC_2]|nr:MAG: 30S ribosomal protein S2 [Candidatus Heimdallarchaeota archaeon LC_2]
MSTDLALFSEEIDDSQLLIPLDEYLTSGVHIGTTIATKHMQPFIFRVRKDGLYVLDIKKTDDRIRQAGKILASYEPEDVLVCSSRQYGTVPSTKLARLCNFKTIPGRFVPGTLTNPNSKHYMEPKLLFINDPRADKQALQEAIRMNIPVVSLCDSDNLTSFVDLVVPVNNKGRRALARVYLLIATQVLRERGELGEDEELGLNIDDFSFKVVRS